MSVECSWERDSCKHKKKERKKGKKKERRRRRRRNSRERKGKGLHALLRTYFTPVALSWLIAFRLNANPRSTNPMKLCFWTLCANQENMEGKKHAAYFSWQLSYIPFIIFFLPFKKRRLWRKCFTPKILRERRHLLLFIGIHPYDCSSGSSNNRFGGQEKMLSYGGRGGGGCANIRHPN